MNMKLKAAIAFACAVIILVAAEVQAQQSESEFQNLMPVTGTVDTYFGEFELDHSFPAEGEAEKIYDLMDHQRAAQLYLWGLPIAGMTRLHQGYVDAIEDYGYNKLLSVKSFNARRGVLTANETTHYFWGVGDTRDAALVLKVPKGLAVGMIVDMWQQSPTDLGVFGPNAGEGDHLVIVGPNTPADQIPEPADGQDVHKISTNQVFYLMRMLG
ncbi:lipoprotein, partial [Rhodopirellula maiorica SM1]